MEPIQASKKGGGVGEITLGVGKGLVGLVFKPIGGFLQLLSNTVLGIHNTPSYLLDIKQSKPAMLALTRGTANPPKSSQVSKVASPDVSPSITASDPPDNTSSTSSASSPVQLPLFSSEQKVDNDIQHASLNTNEFTHHPRLSIPTVKDASLLDDVSPEQMYVTHAQAN